MSRIPHGAKVLLDELTAIYPDATYEAEALDGLGVQRGLRIDVGKEKVEEVYSLLLAALSDKRLESTSHDEEYVYAYFVDSIVADKKDKFDLAAAHKVVKAQAESDARVEESLDALAEGKATIKKTTSRRKKTD